VVHQASHTPIVTAEAINIAGRECSGSNVVMNVVSMQSISRNSTLCVLMHIHNDTCTSVALALRGVDVFATFCIMVCGLARSSHIAVCCVRVRRSQMIVIDDCTHWQASQQLCWVWRDRDQELPFVHRRTQMIMYRDFQVIERPRQGCVYEDHVQTW